mmetsp:Transcript_12012/g.28728  ORF Transcript_12012/g.28728 Transcript_12012/m.28728 type:complete len:586 (+) Transcript_12012:138-1895(+)
MISSKTVILLLLSLSASSAKLGGGTEERKLESNERELRAYTDYANRPTKEVKSFGSNPSQILGHCEGDCDSNNDCGLGLICFQRTKAYQEVPGCNGGKMDDTKSDYCIKPSDLEVSGPPDLRLVTQHPNEGSLGRCEGECDIDDDCEGDLVCYQKNDCVYVPGCRGGEYDYSYTDYCVRKSDVSAGKLALDIGSGYNLQLCQGDCDYNSDCATGLICQQRNANEPVSGCIGGENNLRTDYCVSPNNRGNSRKDVIESSLDGGSTARDLKPYNQEALDWLINADLWVPSADEETPQELWRERYAMTALYFATEGDKWFDPRNYLSVDSVCTWNGNGDEIEVYCDENGRVSGVIGRENGMLGSIPSALQALTMLERIDFSRNNIRNSIPSELGLLTHLTRIDLYENDLTGSIAKELGSLKNLEEIALFGNALTGSLPAELSNWSNLREFSINDNAISGSIPNIGSWSKLKFLELSNNRITGSLPEWGDLSNLASLFLSNNRLTGTISSSIPLSLEHFELRSNNVGGSLPTELGLLSDIHTIDLAYNALQGSLPSEVREQSRHKVMLCFDANTPHIGRFSDWAINLAL